MSKIIEFKGICKGIKLTERGIDDPHICVQILTEDDKNWFASKNPFSSSWIDELIEELQIAKSYMETQEPDIYNGVQYGWKFKSE